MNPFFNQRRVLPAFPRTLHLPHNPNASSDDYVASPQEASVIFNTPVNIEEKIDGASVGMTLFEDHPLLRNRDHILSKGFYKDTPAKEQFRPMWNWFYDNQSKFEKLIENLGNVSVYGEWCLGQHGLEYVNLPDWFIAYDIYDYEIEKFLAPTVAREQLRTCGFVVPHAFIQGNLNWTGTTDDYEALAEYANCSGWWTKNNEKGEGIYLKTYDDEFVVNRFKMVRPDFVRGALWSPDKLSRNTLRK